MPTNQNGPLRWTYVKPLRNWQERAIRKLRLAYDRDGRRDFLCVATPGAGKTVLGLRAALFFLNADIAQRIVVVCPTDHLTRQWRDKADECGIQLQGDFKNAEGHEAADYKGVCVTYQQVAANPRLHALNCRQTNTFVIFDEIHHAGDGQTWAEALREAFGDATFRLAMSGTPFRTDDKEIPFVEYERNADGIYRSKADDSYSYGEALSDKTCRPILFPSYEGHMEWLYDGQIQAAQFQDKLPDEESRRRLRTALDLHGEWLPSIIEEAHRELCRVRSQEQSDAAGLILAIDQAHAYGIAKMLERITGRPPVIAVSDDKDSSAHIGRFVHSHDPWIVAVKMVSEGVDIPRLRVGIYATNVISELFFRQAVGRFVRAQTDAETQSAYLFIPRDDVLVSYAMQVREERDHQIAEDIATLDQDMQEWLEREISRRQGDDLFMPANSTPSEYMGTVVDEDFYDRSEMLEAERVARECGVYGAAIGIVAKVLRYKRGQGDSAPLEATVPFQMPEPPLEKRKGQLRDICNRLVSHIVQITGEEHRER